VTSGAAAGIALGVVGCVGGIVAVIFVAVKMGASGVAAGFKAVPSSV